MDFIDIFLLWEACAIPLSRDVSWIWEKSSVDKVPTAMNWVVSPECYNNPGIVIHACYLRAGEVDSLVSMDRQPNLISNP